MRSLGRKRTKKVSLAQNPAPKGNPVRGQRLDHVLRLRENPDIVRRISGGSEVNEQRGTNLFVLPIRSIRLVKFQAIFVSVSFLLLVGGKGHRLLLDPDCLFKLSGFSVCGGEGI